MGCGVGSKCPLKVNRRPGEGMNCGLDRDMIEVAIVNNVTYKPPRR
jgi:hypothetical protein